jgi:glycosyltransferase involved in cell wall biosynthesis
MNIIVSQQGSRENYNIVKAFLSIDDNLVVYTDFFNKAPYSYFLKAFNHRFDAAIAKNTQHHPIAFFKQKFLKHSQDLIDREYDAWVAKKIEKSKLKPGIFFTFSYNCNQAVEMAKKKGWKVIMGQINPGPKEAEMVQQEYLKCFPNEAFAVPNQPYWKRWKQSLQDVDCLMVNSEWSKHQLEEYYPVNKMEVVPLVANFKPFKKPQIIVQTRGKIKFIYVGAISVRKGFHYLQQALKKMDASTFEFHIVGRLNGPKSLLDLPENVVVHGKLSHEKVLALMSTCDVFVNPTLSDGFALTQLEAISTGLPSIFTKCCAKVYTDGVNGVEMEAFSSQSIIDAMHFCLLNPEKLQEYKKALPTLEKYSLDALKSNLQKITDENFTRSH